MNGLLTYRTERPRGFDPINDPVDLLFDAAGHVWDRIDVETAFEWFLMLLDCL